MGFPGGSAVKNSPAMQQTQEMQETRVWSLDWEDPLEGGNGHPLQYSCLENPMDRGAWWAMVHVIAKCWTDWVAEHVCTHCLKCIAIHITLSDFHYVLLVMVIIFASKEINA